MQQIRKSNQKIRTLTYKRSYLCNNLMAGTRGIVQTFELADRQQVEAATHAIKALLKENDILYKR
jgi:hypothetical protein